MGKHKMKRYRKFHIKKNETQMLVRWGHFILCDYTIFLPIWLLGWTYGCVMLILHLSFVESNIILLICLIPMLGAWIYFGREFVFIFIEKEQFILDQTGLTVRRHILFWRWEVNFLPIKCLCRFDFYFSRKGGATRGVNVLSTTCEEKYEMPAKRKEVQRLIKDMNGFLEELKALMPPSP